MDLCLQNHTWHPQGGQILHDTLTIETSVRRKEKENEKKGEKITDLTIRQPSFKYWVRSLMPL